MRRFIRAITVCLMSGLLSFGLFGCSGSGDDDGSDASSFEVGMANITEDDMTNAYYLMATAMPENTPVTSLYIMGSPSDKIVRATFTLVAEDGDQPQMAEEAESLLLLYSQMCAEAALASAQETGNEEYIEAWQQVVDEEDAITDGQGGLFDYYKAIVVIKSEDGDITVDGEREAGPDSTWNWQ